ncbi:transcriptional regulator [Sphingomonas dokdonensis]|uniref:transcriptional regulator n=1 Tax=Sphingomonas dokdonensis TaxID=344880 RepID=UPI000B4B2E87|nr:YdaS family helix-turn-helix protein [Sphingomonas dokdonensis]
MSSLTTPNQALSDAVDAAGGQSALGRLLGTSQAAVWKWVRRGKPLPAEHVLKVEEATGISRHRLRPDVYGPEPTEGAVV